MLSRKLTRSIAIGTSAIAVAGGAYGIASATSSGSSAVAGTTPTAATPPAVASATTAGKMQPNARSGPAAGGTSGTVGSVSKSSFTLTTSAGQKVTVDKTSSTNYHKGTSAASASAIAKGATVLVLGTTNGTSITATQVIVQPVGGGSATSAANVIPFQQGAPTTAKKVGQIPASFSQGSGTIVSGTAANKATEAALAAYPGGVVNRVVKLSNGDYNVHYIGVNWPHHIFVDQNFKVIGAE
ncbi:MAG: hypothetical protein QOK36_812 [Gaiellales bacterium]|jgi:hypothetical protein|nr:hypothetical protein [Gaiellales bacterium]